MKYLKTTLFVIALMIVTAGSAFASLSDYYVTVDTSALVAAGDTTGYLYFQYTTTSSVASTATVSNFNTNGKLGAQDTVDVVNGSAVTGTLPTVVFANTNSVNDYNQAITFGKSLSFDLELSAPVTNATTPGVSTFSLGLFADASGLTPLMNVNDQNIAGTALAINLNDNGTTSANVLGGSPATVLPTPIPPSALLMGFSLFGLAGLKKRIFG